MRLQTGQPAKPFAVRDIFDRPVSLQDFSGKKLMLSFYRYASCPLCNLRVHELIARYPDYRARGMDIVAFFQSPVESIRRYVGRQDAPFPIIADPQRTVYRQYGVEMSIWGMIAAGFWWHPRMVIANLKGFWFGKMEGNIALVPADFLINPNSTIHTAFYGTTIADHVSLAQVDAFVSDQPV